MALNVWACARGRGIFSFEQLIFFHSEVGWGAIVNKVSISPTFYVQLFRTKVLREAFLYLHLRFKLFWQKNIGANTLIKCWCNCKQGVFKCTHHLQSKSNPHKVSVNKGSHAKLIVAKSIRERMTLTHTGLLIYGSAVKKASKISCNVSLK